MKRNPRGCFRGRASSMLITSWIVVAEGVERNSTSTSVGRNKREVNSVVDELLKEEEEAPTHTAVQKGNFNEVEPDEANHLHVEAPLPLPIAILRKLTKRSRPCNHSRFCEARCFHSEPTHFHNACSQRHIRSTRS